MTQHQRARSSGRRLHRHFGSGVVALAAVAAIAGASGVASASPTTPVSADASSQSDAGSRERAFAAASAEYGVPQSLLEAVSFSQTRWDFRPGHSTTGGYGPMHLVDLDLGSASEARGLGSPKPDAAADAEKPTADTLAAAAKLTGLSEDTLKSDETANIRGGAAVLAAAQKRLGGPLGASSDPGAWYAAVAEQSGSARELGAGTFADDTYAVLASGAARTTNDGKAVSLLPAAVSPQKAQLAKLKLAKANNSAPDCPNSLDCEWIPAPYQQLSSDPTDYGNHDLADRPRAPKITGILIHNTEGSYETTLKLVTDPTYLSWHFTLRSSDGHIAQNVLAKNVAWHAGNWYVNMHSIGLEHEGYAASGAQWFSEPMYRTSARLVKYLAHKYDVPIDRQHIFGHDQVPGILPANVPGMHWDPGPYWDWEHYFHLLGRPLVTKVYYPGKDLVRILPGFSENQQPLTGCVKAGVPCDPQGTNFVYLHQSPSESAPLINDIGIKANGAPATQGVSDIGAKAQAGLEFAVADRQGDWTAIWFNGVKGWFHNPASKPTAVGVKGSYVVPKAGAASAPVYGRAYPEAAAYPAGIPYQTVTPLQYKFAAGQRYVVADFNTVTDYYAAKTFSLDTPNDHIDVVGQDRYLQISLGHRWAYVRAADVDVVKAK